MNQARTQPAAESVPRLALTVREAAASLGTSINSVRAMIRRGELHPIRVGYRQTKMLIPVAQIHTMLANVQGEDAGGHREAQTQGWDYRLPRAAGGRGVRG